MKAFLMIGQSNMAGRGDFGEVEPIRNPRCFMLRNGRWQPMSEPVNPDRSILEPIEGTENIHSGVSLAPSFADAYAEAYQEEVGLIPCADGGTCIDQWRRGEVLFDHAVLQTGLARRSAQLAGILWHQGESDSVSLERAATYQEKLVAFFRDLREALGCGDVPVVMGELADVSGFRNGLFRYHREVTAEIRRAAARIPRCAVVGVEGLTLRADRAHFDSRSLRALGRRYFDAYQRLMREE